jgi:alkylhydroperoxidase family enzyme
VLRFATLLTSSYPGSVEQGDLDDLGVHLSQQEVLELVAVIATANRTNRFNDGLQTPLS